MLLPDLNADHKEWVARLDDEETNSLQEWFGERKKS